MLFNARLIRDMVVNLVNPGGTLVRRLLVKSSWPIAVVAGMIAMISCIRLSPIARLKQRMSEVPGYCVEAPQVQGVIKDTQGQ